MSTWVGPKKYSDPPSDAKMVKVLAVKLTEPFALLRSGPVGVAATPSIHVPSPGFVSQSPGPLISTLVMVFVLSRVTLIAASGMPSRVKEVDDCLTTSRVFPSQVAVTGPVGVMVGPGVGLLPVSPRDASAARKFSTDQPVTPES